jgi:hypothetical protein
MAGLGPAIHVFATKWSDKDCALDHTPASPDRDAEAATTQAARAGISLNRDLATDLAAVPQYWRSAIASGPLDMRAPIGLHCSPIGI